MENMRAELVFELESVGCGFARRPGFGDRGRPRSGRPQGAA
jgi:hypothetical protein